MAVVYTSFKEVDRSDGDNKIFLYFLLDEQGGEHLAATGALAPAPVDELALEDEAAQEAPPLVMTYRGSFRGPPSCEPLETTNHVALVVWLNGIVRASQQQAPVAAEPFPAADPSGTEHYQQQQSQPPPQQQPRPPPQQPRPAPQQQPVEVAEVAAGPPAPAPAAPSAPAAEPAAAAQPPAPQGDQAVQEREGEAQLFFVSYRKEFYQHVTGAVLMRWWLKDNTGREHVAIETVQWGPTPEDYIFEAPPPFCEVKPYRCSTQHDADIYCKDYIPSKPSQDELPAARAEPEGHAAAGAPGRAVGSAEQQQEEETAPEPPAKRRPGRPRKHPLKAPKKGTAAAAAPPAAAAAEPATGSTANRQENSKAGQGVTVPAGSGAAPAAFTTSANRRNKALESCVEAAVQQLELLRTEHGAQYCVTLVTREGEMRVLSSAAPAAVAPLPAAAAPPAPAPASAPAPAPQALAPQQPQQVPPQQQQPQQVPPPQQPQQQGQQPAVPLLTSLPLPPVPPVALPTGIPFPPPGVPLPPGFPGLMLPGFPGSMPPPAHLASMPAAQQMAAIQGGRPPLMAAVPVPVAKVNTGSLAVAAVAQTAGYVESDMATADTEALADSRSKRKQEPGSPSGGGEGALGKKQRLSSDDLAEKQGSGSKTGLAHLSSLAKAELDRKEEEEQGVKALVAGLGRNNEAYVQGPWRRDTYAPHLIQEISSYVLAEDCGEKADGPALLAKLRSSLPASTVPEPDMFGREEELLILPELPPALSSADVALRNVWGLDRFTRKNIFDALAHCPALVGGPEVTPEESLARREEFIQRRLLPALNCCGDKGWDLSQALRLLRYPPSGVPLPPPEVAAAAEALEVLMEGVERSHRGPRARKCNPEDREYFRVHPKGEGVVCVLPHGLPANAFVAEYLGELYSAWRWFERQPKEASTAKGVARQRQFTRMGASAEFYNIQMERPRQDAKGYDVLYINAVTKGNFTSRLSHSCNPNCKTVTVVAGGRLTIGIWTTRPVAQGEELTLDYSCETESEREYANSVCLCGAADCRGSFLYLVDNSDPAKNQYLASHHHFLERCRLLVAAGAEPHLSFEDQERLSRHGFRDFLLTDGIPGAKGTPLPSWLRKWAALVLEFIEAEAAALPALLRDPSNPANGEETYTEEEAAEEVRTQAGARVQALAVALDKAKLCLRHQSPDARGPPLRQLSDAEVVQFLWTGKDSVARRAVGALVSFTRAHSGGGGKGISAATAKAGRARLLQDRTPGAGTPSASQARSASVVTETAADADSIQVDTLAGEAPAAAAIAAAADEATPSGAGGPAQQREAANGAEAAGAAAAGPSGSKGLAAAGAEANSIQSAVECLAATMEKSVDEFPVNGVEEARTGLRMLAGVLRAAGPSHAALHDVLILYASTRTFLTQTDYEAFTVQLKNGEEGGRYPKSYLWGLLNYWFKSTDESFAVVGAGGAAERRGCFSLPDPECCYLPVFASGKYARTGGERLGTLQHLRSTPLAPWPHTSSFSFRNTQRVFGSPQMDAVLAAGAGGGAGSQLAALVEGLASMAF